MKKIIFFLILFFCFSSCTQKDVLQNTELEQSLKDKITIKDDKAFWNDSLEEEILQEDVKKVQNISEKINPSFKAISSLSLTNKDVYPYIQDLGSLDLSLMDKELYYFISDFCNKLKNASFSQLQTFFDEEYIFTLVFFEQEIKTSWKSFFNVKYPKKNLFNSYLICAPLDNFDLIEVPIRFYNSYGNLDIKIFIGNNKKKYSIKNIEILGGAKKNAE